MEARYTDDEPSAVAPAAVVSPQFCAPSTVALTVIKKAMSFSGGDSTVTDAGGAAVLRVEGVWFSVRRRRVIHGAAGRPILTMENKVYTMHDKWKVFRGDSTSSSDLLFTVRKAAIFQMKTNMDVFLARNTTEKVCDFKIKGGYFESSFAFYRGNSSTILAQMFLGKRERHTFRDGGSKFTMSNVLRGKDTYSVTVFPHVDYVFITALVVILDEIRSARRRSR